MIKRILRKILFFMTCMLCMTVYCECNDDDHHHDHDGDDNDHHALLKQDEQHKANIAVNLACPAEVLGSAIADACERDVPGIVYSVNLSDTRRQ
jgi:hypothetical protein